MGERDFLLCLVHTDEGITGFGEPYPIGPNRAVVEAINDLAEWIIGRDPRDIVGLWNLMYAHSRFPGGSILNAAISGIEHALWDIAGKAAGLPVYRLLGGKCRDRVRIYQTAGGASAQECAEASARLVANGMTAVKIGPFPADWEQLPWPAAVASAAERIAAVRDAVGPLIGIGVDVHAQVYEPVRAVELIDALAPYRPMFVEEPLRPENHRALATVKRATSTPIATGEMLYTIHEFRSVIEEQAVDIIQPDIALCGGILEMKRIAAVADAHYVTVAPHNPLGPVATAASLHFALSTQNFMILEYVDRHQQPVPGLVRPPLIPEDGYLQVPEAPGLGIALDLSLLERRAPRNWRREGSFRPDGSAGFI